jgi:hypothetical protein
MSSKLYIAYGSNLNVRQMAKRCPGSELIENGVIEEYDLRFKGMQGNAHATIEESEGDEVPVAIWRITDSDERNLDVYEGFPNYYSKKSVVVRMHDGEDVTGMTYIMDTSLPYGIPSEAYVDTVFEGYLNCGLSLTYLMDSVEKSAERYAKNMMDRILTSYDIQNASSSDTVLIGGEDAGVKAVLGEIGL